MADKNTTLGIVSAILLAAIFIFLIYYYFSSSNQSPTIIYQRDRPIYNTTDYIYPVVDRSPLFVPQWWGSYAPMWGAKTGYDKPFHHPKAGLPGMGGGSHLPPPPPPAPTPAPAPAPAPAPEPTPTPSPTPSA